MNVRWHMLRILMGREFLRVRKNPSALVVMGLMIALSMLLATSHLLTNQGQRPTCWIVYWEDGPWIEQLRNELPKRLPIAVVDQEQVRRYGEELRYPPRVCAIELWPADQLSGDTPARPIIRYRYTGDDPGMLWPYATWFWETTTRHFGARPGFDQQSKPIKLYTSVFPAGTSGAGSASELLKYVDLLGAVMLFVVQFFGCCHLMVSFTSQDRERGTLTALALTPANTTELLIAKFVMHGVMTLAVSGVIVGILKPAALLNPLLWCVLAVTDIGLMSVATVIVSLARTQSTAAMLTLSYMLTGTVMFFLAMKFSAFGLIKQATFEHYSFTLLFLSLKNSGSLLVPKALTTQTTIVALWLYAAVWLFQRRGWR